MARHGRADVGTSTGEGTHRVRQALYCNDYVSNKCSKEGLDTRVEMGDVGTKSPKSECPFMFLYFVI